MLPHKAITRRGVWVLKCPVIKRTFTLAVRVVGGLLPESRVTFTPVVRDTVKATCGVFTADTTSFRACRYVNNHYIPQQHVLQFLDHV